MEFFLEMKVHSEHCTQNIVNINKTQYKQANVSTILQVGLLSLCFGWHTLTDHLEHIY